METIDILDGKDKEEHPYIEVAFTSEEEKITTKRFYRTPEERKRALGRCFHQIAVLLNPELQ